MQTPITATIEPVTLLFEIFSFDIICDRGIINNGLVEFKTVAIEAEENFNPSRQNHVPRNVPKNDVKDSLPRRRLFVSNGLSDNFRLEVAIPQIISRIKPDICLINEASRDELEISANFEKIILAEQQTDASRP